MATGIACLLLLAFFSSSSSAFSEELALVVGQSTALQIVPRLQVTNSPGAKANVNVLAERVHIYGLSRMKNLRRFSDAVTIKVTNLNSSFNTPNFEICFHRNLSLGVGMCPPSQWQKASKGSCVQRMSPFDNKILDIRMSRSSLQTLELTLQEDSSAYRIVFLTLGTMLITLAPIFSESLVFYYSSAMAVGIILVVLIVLFQGMKVLPTGRASSLAIFIYSCFIGVGAFFLSYLPSLFHTVLSEMGISEDMYIPLEIFLLLFIAIAGAWLGFWVVRKLILTEEGAIDTTISIFVAWSIRLLGAVMILQCTLDPLLAVEALISAVLISSVLRKVSRPRLLHRLYGKLRKSAIIIPQYSSGLSNGAPPPPTESDTFYSSYHNTPQRRKLSKEEWKSITKECTKKGLQELVSSPDFSRWAAAHAERITLAPIKKEPWVISWLR
ncbi:uncharacterized protein LOC130820657 [Amaranthus tricolor]|uniref:uncharacterized protein LOC130820657 n=1 Tax=Amaranthus tricolor TaxID=29722 RepID=UPI002582CC9B|nr:uncharacterized protein LOC130820657 [Amaranthus tricolor]